MIIIVMIMIIIMIIIIIPFKNRPITTSNSDSIVLIFEN